MHCANVSDVSVLQPAGYNHVLGSVLQCVATELRTVEDCGNAQPCVRTEVETPHWLKVIAGTKLTHKLISSLGCLDVWMFGHLPVRITSKDLKCLSSCWTKNKVKRFIVFQRKFGSPLLNSPTLFPLGQHSENCNAETSTGSTTLQGWWQWQENVGENHSKNGLRN